MKAPSLRRSSCDVARSDPARSMRLSWDIRTSSLPGFFLELLLEAEEVGTVKASSVVSDTRGRDSIIW